MSVMECIEKRRSIRKYANKPLEKEKLEQVLEAGRKAPSARNRQEWKFIAVTDPKLRAHMPEACCGQAMVGEAPVDLVVCATKTGIMNCGQESATVDCSIAMSFMMLEATELGLGTCWLGAFDADAVSKLLNLPEDWIPVVVSPLGYPGEEPTVRPRKDEAEVVVKME